MGRFVAGGNGAGNAGLRKDGIFAVNAGRWAGKSPGAVSGRGGKERRTLA